MKKSILFILISISFFSLFYLLFLFKNDTAENKLIDHKKNLENETLTIDEKIEFANLYLESAILTSEINEVINAYSILGNIFLSNFNYQKSLVLLYNFNICLTNSVIYGGGLNYNILVFSPLKHFLG